MDEELRRRLELEHIRLTRKPIEDQVFASDEPITTLRHIFKGVEDTVLEYNAEYVTEPVSGKNKKSPKNHPDASLRSGSAALLLVQRIQHTNEGTCNQPGLV